MVFHIRRIIVSRDVKILVDVLIYMMIVDIVATVARMNLHMVDIARV